MDRPELGFKEWKTADRVCAVFDELGLPYERNLALTGVKARLKGKGEGPTVALMGELDALIVPDHPGADLSTGAAHACGHNAQIAGLLGAAYGLVESSAGSDLAGDVIFFAVPAEEYVEIEYAESWCGRERQPFWLESRNWFSWGILMTWIWQ